MQAVDKEVSLDGVSDCTVWGIEHSVSTIPCPIPGELDPFPVITVKVRDFR